jgi:malonate transporter and related proteins
MAAVVAALIPVFALILLGAALRRAGFPGDGFWPPLERLTYFVLFPPLLFHAIVSADLENAPFGRLGLALAVMMIVAAAAMIAVQRIVQIPGPAFSSFFQGVVRWNSFVALAAIGALYGKDGLALAAVAIAVMVPLANAFSVLVLVGYAQGETASARMLIEQVVRNPLIQACALGIAIKVLGVPVPDAVLAAADMLGKASLTLGLFAVGASLDLNVARMEARIVASASALKLIATPVLAAALCWALGVDGVARGCAVICAAVPGAASAYILAKQLGGDAPLMAGITTVQTLAAMITMPLMLTLLI